MNKSETLAKLADALAKAQGEMPVVKFNATNPFLKNKYADLGALIETSRPILQKYGLAVVQLVSSEGEAVSVETVLLHSSGEFIASTISLPLGDEKGKSNAQVAGSIITYLRRYAYAAVLGLYADEDTDGTNLKPQAHTEKHADAPAKEPLTLESAMKVQNSEGVPYGKLPTDKLMAMAVSVNKALKLGVNDEKRAEFEEKRDAIKLILASRSSGEQ